MSYPIENLFRPAVEYVPAFPSFSSQAWAWPLSALPVQPASMLQQQGAWVSVNV